MVGARENRAVYGTEAKGAQEHDASCPTVTYLSHRADWGLLETGY